MRTLHRRTVFSHSDAARLALRGLIRRFFAPDCGGRATEPRPRASLAAAVRRLAVGLVVASALAASSAQAFAGSFDGGGRVGAYLDLVAAANASGERMEIAGVCASACTMKLGARGACVYSDAQLWFHAARSPDGSVNALATLAMLQQYPRGVRAWAKARGALTSFALTPMSGVEAIALGVPDCERVHSPGATTGGDAKVCLRGPDGRAAAAPAAALCARRSPSASASLNASFAR
jgi:hypothetical protein